MGTEPKKENEMRLSSTWQRPRKGSVIISCGCGKKYTAAGFRDMDYCGTEEYPGDPGDPTVMEYRNCNCMSTRAVWLDDDGEIVVEGAK